MMMKKASGGDSPLRHVPGRASRPSGSRVDDGGGLQYVLWKMDWVLRVFTSRGIYRRKGGVRRQARRPHHLVAWPGAGPRHPMVWLAPGPPPSQLWTPSPIRKIGTLAFILSNSENISCVAFLKHKSSRK
jgi:hypothetical protein